MSGKLLRTVCTAALATAVVAGPAAGGVPALGGPATQHRALLKEPGAEPAGTDLPGAGLPETDLPGTGLPGTGLPGAEPLSTGPDRTAETAPDQGAPGPPARVPDALTRLRALYRESEDAGAAYTAAARQLAGQRVRTARLGRELTRAREAFAVSRREAGRLAREQYQGRSELSELLRVFLARRPEQALNEEHLRERVAAHRLAVTARLERGARRAEALTRASRAALDRERVLAARQKRARDAAGVRLRQVEETLASLSAAEIAELTSPEAQRRLPTGTAGAAGTAGTNGAAGAPGAGPAPTAQGAAAVRYAVGQIGKPYLWGAEGPGAYDCSGLTSQAWAAAGREIPRTSQEQWRELSPVPLRSLRPGDLVVYFPGATHVGIYLGGGNVVHAPRPGTTVKVSPLGANPVLGAVRPDPEGAPLAAYAPPPLPEGATAGPDTGYAQTEAPQM